MKRHIALLLVTFPLLTAAKGNGCSLGGDVPVGSESPAAQCGPGACDGLAASLEAKICGDGSSVGRTVCATSDTGACFWDFPACPSADAGPERCAPADCNDLSAPTDAKLCADGSSVSRTVCATSSAGTCFWDFPACPTADAGPAVDGGGCGCPPDLSWGPDGGLVAYTDSSEVTACTSYRHVRRFADGSTPEVSCQEKLAACGAGPLGAGELAALVGSADVQAAIAAAPVVYGVDPRPVDGSLLRIRIGSAVIDVGGPCGGASGCAQIPANVASLASLLRAIDQQELAKAPCAGQFPPN